jgi:amidase
MGKIVNAFCDDALGTKDAVGVAEAIAKKEISAAEAREAAIARAEKVNADLNAIALKTYEYARNENTLATGGLLYGVPSFVKDTDDIKGYPTQMGTGSFKAKIAGSNSRFLNQYISTGLGILGKTTMPEFGLICSTENERWGITRNPWNTGYTTGGSSSGSGAMVASGVVPIASANDGAGSIRIPANCCGLVGLKPSRHRLIAVAGGKLMPLQIVYQGVLTRSVRDTAAFYAAAEKYYKHPRLPEMGYVQQPSAKRLRIAFFDNPAPGKLGHMDEDTNRVINETALLLQQLGHQVDKMPLPIDIDVMSEHYLNYYGFMAYAVTHMSRVLMRTRVDHSQLEPFTVGLASRFKRNVLRTPESIRKLRLEAGRVEQLFGTYDVLMTPVVSHSTPAIGHFSPLLSYEHITRRALEYASYAGLQNVSGAPAISLPLGINSNNMPLGVHFTAPYGLDKRLLELAYELEQARPFRLINSLQTA